VWRTEEGGRNKAVKKKEIERRRRRKKNAQPSKNGRCKLTGSSRVKSMTVCERRFDSVTRAASKESKGCCCHS